jgi:hypothetical protein
LVRPSAPRHELPLNLAALHATMSILNGFTNNTKHCTLTNTPNQI